MRATLMLAEDFVTSKGMLNQWRTLFEGYRSHMNIQDSLENSLKDLGLFSQWCALLDVNA